MTFFLNLLRIEEKKLMRNLLCLTFFDAWNAFCTIASVVGEHEGRVWDYDKSVYLLNSAAAYVTPINFKHRTSSFLTIVKNMKLGYLR